VTEAAETEAIDNCLFPSRNNSDSDQENTEILDVLETIDMSEIPVLKELGTKAE
jgi:hypothetical protein